jgi:uncharacterized protein YdaU (DUF1376 family)
VTQSPAFQFYPNDFTGSGKVGTMTTEEVGMYVLLLCLDWNETGFEYDEKRLSRWCRVTPAKFRRDWAAVSECFVERDGRLYNPRLEAERIKQAEWREKSRRGGVASGQARAKGGSTTPEPPPQPKGNTPSPSSITKKKGESIKAVQSSGADAPKLEIGAHSWPAEGAALWVETVGRMSAGHFGKALKPMVDLHGWAKIRIALVRWIVERQSNGQPMKLEWFADNATAEVNRPAQEIVDEFGALTAYGKRMVSAVKHA